MANTASDSSSNPTLRSMPTLPPRVASARRQPSTAATRSGDHAPAATAANTAQTTQNPSLAGCITLVVDPDGQVHVTATSNTPQQRPAGTEQAPDSTPDPRIDQATRELALTLSTCIAVAKTAQQQDFDRNWGTEQQRAQWKDAIQPARDLKAQGLLAAATTLFQSQFKNCLRTYGPDHMLSYFACHELVECLVLDLESKTGDLETGILLPQLKWLLPRMALHEPENPLLKMYAIGVSVPLLLSEKYKEVVDMLQPLAKDGQGEVPVVGPLSVDSVLGIALARVGRQAEALPMLEAAAPLLDQFCTENTSNGVGPFMLLVSALVDCLLTLGRSDNVQRKRDSVLDTDPMNTRYLQAEVWALKAFRRSQKELPPDGGDTAQATFDYCKCLRRVGKHPRAVSLLTNLLRIVKKSFGPNDWRTLRVVRALANALVETPGQVLSGLTLHLEAVARRESGLDPDMVDMIAKMTRLSSAQVRAFLLDPDEAGRRRLAAALLALP